MLANPEVGSTLGNVALNSKIANKAFEITDNFIKYSQVLFGKNSETITTTKYQSLQYFVAVPS